LAKSDYGTPGPEQKKKDGRVRIGEFVAFSSWRENRPSASKKGSGSVRSAIVAGVLKKKGGERAWREQAENGKKSGCLPVETSGNVKERSQFC